MMVSDWDEASVLEGTRRMLDRRSMLLEQGERMIGWKLAFGAPHWLDRFGHSGPLVGYLAASNVKESGATVSCQDWIHPVAEPEIAVYFGTDVDEPDRVAESISGVGAAIELADVDSPPDDLGRVLAGNIFHRAVILGQPDHSRVGGSVVGMRAHITNNGSVVADTEELTALTGDLVSILGHTARLLQAAGAQLKGGELVIAGSVVPAVPLRPGDRVRFELVPLLPISVTA